MVLLSISSGKVIVETCEICVPSVVFNQMLHFTFFVSDAALKELQNYIKLIIVSLYHCVTIAFFLDAACRILIILIIVLIGQNSAIYEKQKLSANQQYCNFKRIFKCDTWSIRTAVDTC